MKPGFNPSKRTPEIYATLPLKMQKYLVVDLFIIFVSGFFCLFFSAENQN
jgi:hypothetical protein